MSMMTQPSARTLWGCASLVFLALCPVLGAFAQQSISPGALTTAVTEGHLSLVSDLLAQGADPDDRDDRGHRPLTNAVLGGRLDILQRLLDASAHPDQRDAQGFTAFILAVMEEREDMIVTLLAAGADPDVIADLGDGRSVSPLSVALNRGDYPLARRLVEAGASPHRLADPEENPIPILGLPYLDVPLDRRLWGITADLTDASSSPDWNRNDLYSLHVAAVTGDWHGARELLDRGAQVDREDELGVTPLMAASWHGHSALVALFLQRGAVVNRIDQSGRTALVYAAVQGHDGILHSLLQAGASVDPPGIANLESSAVFAALAAGRRSSLTILLEAGADPHLRDRDDTTLLMAAAWLGDFYGIREIFPLADGALGQLEPVPMDLAGRSALAWALAAFERDRVHGREVGDDDRGNRHLAAIRLLARRNYPPGFIGAIPASDLHRSVMESWSPGKIPQGYDDWRRLAPSPVPLLPGDGDVHVYRILRDEEPGVPTTSGS